jgi:hypothetical protein
MPSSSLNRPDVLGELVDNDDRFLDDVVPFFKRDIVDQTQYCRYVLYR